LFFIAFGKKQYILPTDCNGMRGGVPGMLSDLNPFSKRILDHARRIQENIQAAVRAVLR
jgi:hypothetical protein